MREHVERPGGSSVGEPVDADDDLVAAVDGLLGRVGGVLNLALDQALLDGGERAAGRVDAPRSAPRASCSIASRARLDRPGAADRIDGVGDAGLGRDDLLRAQREARRVLGRQRQRLVAAVAVQRLRAAQHGGHGLQGHAHDVVVGLLRRQRAAGRLRVEAQLHARAGGWRRSGRA